MSADELHTLERERRVADRRYNDALTAFDAALLRTPARADIGTFADVTMPPLPTGWRARSLRVVAQWLAPWFDRQRTRDAQTAEAIAMLVNRDHERAVAFEQFQAALITFLQQITAFIDTKDRQLGAAAGGRIDEQQKTLAALQQRLDDTLPELRAQIGVLQRAMEMLKRQAAETASAPAVTTSPVSVSASATAPPSRSTDDYKYVGFEDAFRGSDHSVAEKLEAYLPIFAGASDVVDLGCGRGEFLAALRSAGVTARGVDTNAAMVAVAREQGLDVTRNDALGFVASLPDESLGGVIATQVVEHLEPSYLFSLLDALSRTLRQGAPIVLETINPACWYAFFSSYIRDITHVRPVHPETLQYLLRASGFERVEIRYRSPLPDHVKLQMAYVPEDVRVAGDASSATLTQLVDTSNANVKRMNELMFAHMDYAVVGYRI